MNCKISISYKLHSNQEETQTFSNMPFCICCLVQNGPFFSLSLCAHAGFLDMFPILKDDTELQKVVCEDCHIMLRKIYKFKQQVENTCHFLSKKINVIDKFKQRKKKMSQSKIIHHDIPEIKTIYTEAEEDKMKIKNIETALNILNSNATSLKSCDLKSMTEVILQMTTNSLNLESNVKEIPDKMKSQNIDMLQNSVPNSNINVMLPGNTKAKPEFIINESENSKKEFAVEDNETALTVEIKTNSEIGNRDFDGNISVPITLADDSEDCNTSQVFLPIKLDKDELLKEREAKMKSEAFLQWPYRCEVCIIGFQYNENLYDHNIRKHQKKNGSVTCEICRQSMQSVDFNDHMERHYHRLQCKLCKKRFVLSDEAYQHYEDTHLLETFKRKLTEQAIDKDAKKLKNTHTRSFISGIQSPES